MNNDHEEKAKMLVAAWEMAHGVSRWIMAFAMTDLENRVAAALAQAVEEQKQLGQIAYDQWQTERAAAYKRGLQDAKQIAWCAGGLKAADAIAAEIDKAKK